eukprot:12199362-Alexandrium_andersonii.AAC.1
MSCWSLVGAGFRRSCQRPRLVFSFTAAVLEIKTIARPPHGIGIGRYGPVSYTHLTLPTICSV